MAITQVRAKMGEEWVTLTLNESTGRYEIQLTAPGTSIHQMGGYYPATLEGSNDSGNTTQADSDTMPSLRLVVQETAAPTLTLISPEPGFLTTPDPVIVFEAIDEEGGSGVDPDSFSLEGAAAEEIPGGYRFTWSPPELWADGSHTLTASVSDYDGNTSAVSGAWVVDTTPPELWLKTPYLRHVVDAESVLVSGTAWDANGVEVTVNGAPAGGETFSTAVPLEVGENYITVTARDGAGWETSDTVYMIRLITDRTKADTDALRRLYDKPLDQWSKAEQDWFPASVLRGGYDARTMNRVGIAVAFLAGELVRRGYAPDVSPKTDWSREEAPTLSQGETYRQNVKAIRDAQRLESLSGWPVPDTMRHLNHEGANQIEKALVQTDALFPGYTAWTAGEITCGE